MQTDTRHSRKPEHQTKEKRNFYIALSICLLAAAAAAWSVFSGVMDYMQASRETAVPAVVSHPAPVQPKKKDPPPPQTENSSSAAPVSSAAPEPAEEAAYIASEQFTPPCSGPVVQPFSGDTLVYSKTMRDWRTHPGCDFACTDGEAVLACANGLILETLTDPLWGNIIVAEHGSVTIRYCGVGENFAVHPGDVIRQGQSIGVISAVPCEAADEPHLHIEAFRGDEKLDFAALLS